MRRRKEAREERKEKLACSFVRNKCVGSVRGTSGATGTERKYDCYGFIGALKVSPLVSA